MGVKSESEDILAGTPPQPKLRDARSGSPTGPSVMPKSSGQASSAAMAMMGATPVKEVAEGMAMIEAGIKQVSKHVASIGQLFQPVIPQMRDLGMAAMANLAQGGPGSVDLGGSGAVAPPGMAPAGAPAGAPPIMPMPPM